MTHQTSTALWLRQVALGCVLTGAMAGSAHAADGSLAQAISSVSNFRVQLIDLDANDGIAPGIVFTDWVNGTPGIWADGQMIFRGGNLASSNQASTDLTGDTSNLLPSGAQQVSSTDGLVTVSASPTSLSSVLTLQQSDLSRLVPADPDYFGDRQSMIVDGRPQIGQFPRTPYYAATPSGAYVFADFVMDPFNSGQYSFVLTPNTRMVVTADLSVSAQLDSAQLPQDWQLAAANPSPNDYYVSGSSVMSQARLTLSQASASPGMLDSYPDYESYFAAQTAAFQYSDLYLLAVDSILHNSNYAQAQQGHANMVLDNRTDTEMLGALGMVVASSTRLDGPLQEPALPLPGDVTPSIPEPSTYALMGLGLVGLALAKRRARSA